MLPRLVPEISPLDAICDVVGVGVVGVEVRVGIGDFRSRMFSHLRLRGLAFSVEVVFL